MDGSRYTEDPLEEGWREHPPSLGSLFGAVRRQIGVIVLCMVACAALGFAFVVVSEPHYTATASLYLRSDGGEAQSEAISIMEIDTHAELIRSEETTAAVIEELGLEADPAYAAQSGLLRRLTTRTRELVGLPPADPEPRPEAAVSGLIRAMQEGLSVSRVGNTRIIAVSFTSLSRDFAVDAANAYARAHADSVASRNATSTDRRIARLAERAEEMQRNAAAADATMQEILLGSGQFAADPQALQQHTAELRRQLSQLDADSAALTTQLSVISDGDEEDIFLASALETPEATALLNELGAAEERLAGLRDQPGMTEETLARIQGGIDDIRDNLRQEAARQAGALELELAMNEARHASIAAQISGILGYLASDDWGQLEASRRDKDFYESMYQDYLGRLEAVYREPADSSDLRLVAQALPPPAPSFPNPKVILAIAVTIGLFLGAGLGMFREWGRPDRRAA